MLNYIPYVGPGIMHAILFVIGLLTFDTLWPALIAPLFFMAFTFVEGHFIMPTIIGRQLLLHPLAVFLSLAFWAWLWGPIGAFLATPILIMATVAADHLYPRAGHLCRNDRAFTAHAPDPLGHDRHHGVLHDAIEHASPGSRASRCSASRSRR